VSAGRIARKILGRHFPLFGDAYRKIFVNMDKVVSYMIHQIPTNANVLDVGGGDGYVANLLLSKRSDIRVTITDIASNVGSFVEHTNRNRLTVHPSTDISELQGKFDVITITDVIHHVPTALRQEFFAKISSVGKEVGCSKIIVKDIEPEGFRAKLALLGDLFITGDRNVVQLSANEILFPNFTKSDWAMPDFPNYCITFLSENVTNLR